MLNVINNFKLRISIIIFIGFIIISTITSISFYAMYQFHFTNAYKDANRIVRLYERSYLDIKKDLEYLKLIDFSKSEKEILDSFKTISKIIYEKNQLVNGIVLIKQFKKEETLQEEKILQNLLNNKNIKIRPVNQYISYKKSGLEAKYNTAVYHREPSIVKKDIRGINVSTESNRYKTISKMNFWGKAYLSKPLEIINGSNGHKNSVILYYPLYKKYHNQKYFNWFLAVPITLQNVLDKLNMKHMFIENYIVKLYDNQFLNIDLLCEKECKDNFIELTRDTFSYAGVDNTIVIGTSSLYTIENFWQAILGFTSGIIFLSLIGYYLFYKEKKEQQVKKLELQIQKAHEISKIGHFTWNHASDQITSSNEIVEMFKLSKNIFTFEDIESKYYKNDYIKTKKILYNLINKTIKPKGQFEFRILVDGKIKWLLTKYTAVYNNDGVIKDIFGVTQDITEFKNKEVLLKKQSEEFEKLAIIDKLTNSYNRSHFDKQLENHLEQFKRYEKIFAIILFDIDHFKFVNDNFGHDTGDHVLNCISTITKTALRKSDIFARWGGEEFIILLPNINAGQANIVAQKLKNIIKEHHFDDNFNITCSFGVTQAKDGDTSKELFKRVDTLLYEAKSAGRDMVIKG